MNDGGPAFPQIETDAESTADHPGDSGDTYGHVYSYGCMSLRDYFAAAALQGTLANAELLMRVDVEHPNLSTRKAAARYAYAVADMMLEEREKQS